MPACQCYFSNWSHPLLPPLCSQVCFASLCLHPFPAKVFVSVVRILKSNCACEASHMVPGTHWGWREGSRQVSAPAATSGPTWGDSLLGRGSSSTPWRALPCSPFSQVCVLGLVVWSPEVCHWCLQQAQAAREALNLRWQ